MELDTFEFDESFDACLKQAAHHDHGHDPYECMRPLSGERYEWSFL